MPSPTVVPPASAVADVLALAGADGWLTPPLNPIVPAPTPLAGRARTVQLAARAQPGVAVRGRGLAPLRELLSGDLAGCVVVVAGADDARGAVWGEILSTAAAAHGVVAVVVDGAVRDRPAMTGVGLPVYASSERVVGPAPDVQITAVDEPVKVVDVSIHAGDTIVVDGSGCVRVPAEHADVIVARAIRYAAAEDAVLAALRDGSPLTDAYRYKKAVVDDLSDPDNKGNQ